MHRFTLFAPALALTTLFLVGPTLLLMWIGGTGAEALISTFDNDQLTGRIAFVRLDDEGAGDIWVMDADGANQTNLTDTAGVNEGQPAWSPDGTAIAFTAPGPVVDGAGGLGDIWVMDANPTTDDAANLTDTREPEQQPAWAPDGARLAFVRELAGEIIAEQQDIFAMDADGGNADNLTQTDGNESDPAWSPDGAKIAFAGVRQGGSEILTMDPNGGNEKILTGDGSDAFDDAPDWSPDGTIVAFMKQSQLGGCCEPWEIWAVNRDGSGDTNLTEHPSDDTAPSWSPDGSAIIFASNRDSESDIYTMPAPTTLPPPSETASTTTSHDDVVMRFAADAGALRAAIAQTTSETRVRRLTRGDPPMHLTGGQTLLRRTPPPR